MFHRISGNAVFALVAVACLGLLMAAAPAWAASAASADKYTAASPLLSLKMLDAKQTKLLQRAGISCIQLSRLPE